VPRVRGSDDHLVTLLLGEELCLGGEDDVAIERMWIRGWPAPPAGISPKLGGSAHNGRRNGEVTGGGCQRVKSQETRVLIGTKKFPTDFIVGDLGNEDWNERYT
jgi:hypothetical protein